MRKNKFYYSGCFYNNQGFVRNNMGSYQMDPFYILDGWDEECFSNWEIPSFTDSKYIIETTFHTEIDHNGQCMRNI